MAAREPYPDGQRREHGRVLSPVDNFGRIPMGVLLHETLDDASKLLYAYLTTWDFRRTGRMFGGREEFAEALGWSVSKVDRALPRLEAAGCIRRIRRGVGLVNDIMLLAEVRPVTSDESDLSSVTGGDDPDRSPVTDQDLSPVTHPNTRENARENPERASALSLVDEGKPRARKRTPRDDYFDALEAAFGTASTGSRRAFYGRTITQLMEAGAKPEEIARAAAVMRHRGWENATPEAMLKHWDNLLADVSTDVAELPPADLPRPDPRSFTRSRNPEPW